MDLLKNHYEKIILGVVLIGLALAVAWLPFKIASDKQTLERTRIVMTHPKVKPLTNLNLTIAEASTKRAANPTPINFSEPNKLFNPMPWQKRSDEQLIRADKAGPTAVVVTNLIPLYLRVTLDGITASEAGPRYIIGVQNDAGTTATARRKKQSGATLNSKTELFTIIEAKGEGDQTQLTLLLNDTGERALLTRDKPFLRVESYMADIRYAPENRVFAKSRVGSSLVFNNEEYKIVAINQNEVVLSATSNGKKWTIKHYPDVTRS
jgi:hypothetical protein